MARVKLPQKTNLNNMITMPRPHHRLVQKIERVFIGCQSFTNPPQFPWWQTINEWLIIASLVFLIGLMSDVILRFF